MKEQLKMSVIGLFSELAEIGLTEEKLDKAIGESAEVKEGVIRKAEEVKETWQEI